MKLLIRASALAGMILLASTESVSAFECIRVRRNDPSSPCLRWEAGTATLQMALGSPGRPLLNGSITWDDNGISAALEWNAVGNFRFDAFPVAQIRNPCGAPGPGHVCRDTGPLGDNPVYYTDTICGRDFGDLLALTTSCFAPDGRIANAPVFVNGGQRWNAYDGPTRFDTSGGRRVPIYDLRRVLLHEFGHVLGLDHPDETRPPQSVVAIMNSRTGNLDRLQEDDRAGLRNLYGGGGGPFLPPTEGCAVVTSRRSAWPLFTILGMIGWQRWLRGRTRSGPARGPSSVGDRHS